MKLLLDTNALIWLLEDSDRLGPAARTAILDDANSLLVSTVSLFEMAIKIRIGKLALDLSEVLARLQESDVGRLDIEDRHCLAMAKIEAAPPHRDPFDLMLVAQAISDGLTIISGDAVMRHYPVTLISAD